MAGTTLSEMQKEEKRGGEFAPGETDESLAAFDRRTFLRLMGASAALAGAGELTGCWKPQPLERIVPYVNEPEGVIPGIPRFYASAIPVNGFACGIGRGVIVEQHEGRPTKIEGNPLHPSSLGGTDIFMQASILQLYDPDRSPSPLRGKNPITWGGVLEGLRSFVRERGLGAKVRLRILTGTLASPMLTGQLQTLAKIFPHFQWHTHDVLAATNARAGQLQAFSAPVTPVYDFTRIRRMVSIDAAFLAEEAGGTGAAVRYAREFAHARRLRFQDFGPNQTHTASADTGGIVGTSGIAGTAGLAGGAPTAESMPRFYTAQSTVSYTGAVADHRLLIKPEMGTAILAAIARALGDASSTAPASAAALPRDAATWVQAAAADLKTAGPAGIVLVGEYLPPEAHALGYAINAALGSAGTGVKYLEPIDQIPDDKNGTLAALTSAMNSGEVDLLLILDTNPAFTASADLQFAQALSRFTADPSRLSLHAGGWDDETAELSGWHVPLAHALEAWGDVRGHDGTVSIVQPLIEPLFSAKSAIEIFAAFSAIGLEISAGAIDEASAADLYSGGYDLLRRFWLNNWKSLSPGDREMRWKKTLRDGVLDNSAAAEAKIPHTLTLAEALQAAANLEQAALQNAALSATQIDLAFRPDPAIGDGLWANHPWMQELPKPLTRLTWDNVALLSPATAQTLGLPWAGHESRETVPGLLITVAGKTIEIPAWIQPGQPDGVVTVYLGGGRRTGGKLLTGVGVDVYPLRNQNGLWTVPAKNVVIKKSDRLFALACTQPQQILENRTDIVKSRPIAQMPAQPTTSQTPDLYSTQTESGKPVHLSLYDEYKYIGYKWGMAVDLSACIGCSACVIACQAENNSPIVGKEQVRRGREMHWIRIDTYLGGPHVTDPSRLPSDPQVHFQPMFCQHCENAPCELVCPVEATSHSDEGINEMTYNRCIGTRYCSNNCPYKVRRFNFLQWNPHDVLTWNMQKNPNVTVRSRGVMEKCSFCIQRINRSRIDAKKAWARQSTGQALPHTAPVEMRQIEAGGWNKPRDLPRLRFQTACQQACPTQALVFGDINDAGAWVTALKNRQPWAAIDYGVLTEYNTQPRTSYLERLENPNPDLAPKPAGGDA